MYHFYVVLRSRMLIRVTSGGTGFCTPCYVNDINSSRRNEKKSHFLLPAAGGPCKRTMYKTLCLMKKSYVLLPAVGGPCKRILYKTLCLMVFPPSNHETTSVAEFWDSYLFRRWAQILDIRICAPAAGGPCKRILYKTLCLMVFHSPNHKATLVAEF